MHGCLFGCQTAAYGGYDLFDGIVELKKEKKKTKAEDLLAFRICQSPRFVSSPWLYLYLYVNLK